MQSQLEHGVDAASGFLLELLQAIEVPRIDHQRLLAERVGADAQRHAHVRIVQVVRRAHAQEMHALGLGAALELFEMAIEPLEFGEEPDIECVAIEHADRVVRIDRGDEAVAGVVNGLEVARGHEAGDAGHGEVFWTHDWECAAARSTAASCGAVTRSEYRASIVCRPAMAIVRRNS